MRVAIDTGGTFTDLIAIGKKGEILVSKVPSQLNSPGRALQEALAQARVDPLVIEDIGIGTTVATNTILERTGARVLYVTTAGFEDVPFIGRGNKEELYDLHWNKPQPLIQRRDAWGVNERLDSRGKAIQELAAGELSRVVAELVAEAERDPSVAVAVCTLFSYVDRSHERAIAEALRAALPGHAVSASHEVSPVWREFERSSTTIADAYVKRAVTDYLEGVREALRELGVTGHVAAIKSNGGRLSAEAARERPVDLLLSGPAAGVTGALYMARLAEVENVVTFDMGGTSTDIGLIYQRAAAFRESFDVEWGLPASINSVDIRTIGAGGGSEVWLDDGNLLRVGPKSAGSAPGPVCYGSGGVVPTVTDANVVLGRLNPEYFLGGRLSLDADLAREAFELLASRHQGQSAQELAASALQIAGENMANAVRLMAVEKGYDLREFALVAFGGAGPLHACAVARALGVDEVIVPLFPGQLSALGGVISDERVDRMATLHAPTDHVDPARLVASMSELESDVVGEFGCPAEEVTLHYALGMRYSGQNYEREVGIPAIPRTRAALDAAVSAFHAAHREFYGFASEGHAVEIVNLVVTGTIPRERPIMNPIPPANARPAPGEVRDVYFPDAGVVNCPVYHRVALGAGAIVAGPAIVEEDASTVLLNPGDELEVTFQGLLRIRIGRRSEPAPRRGRAGEATAGDSHLMTVFHHALANIAEEMATVMMRTAYSTIFNEGLDFSTAILNREGSLVAEKNYTPSMIGAMPRTVQWALAELGKDYFEPGDVVVHNDPYRGNCHLPEHMLMKPVFVDGELIAFTGVMGHISEIGGMAVGSFATEATDIYQEGLRLPPVKLMSRGQHVDDVWRIILANHRTPRFSWGDLHAMVGALTIGEKRLLSLVDKRGTALVERTTGRLAAYSERRMRAEITKLPNGTFGAWMYLEDDGVGAEHIFYKVAVTISGDEIVADWTGSDPQVRGATNCPLVVTAAAVYNAVFCVTDPGSDIPRNGGCYEPITVIAPPGTVVNVKHPGACVSGNTETQAKLIDLVLAALEPAAPGRVAAAAGGTPASFVFGGTDAQTGEFFSVYHIDGAGSGATARADGNCGEITRHSNCRNTPIEVLETRYPWRQLEYVLVTDSGGVGEHRGGLGLRTTFEALAPMTITALFDRMLYPPWGLHGGGPGTPTALLIRRCGETEFRTFTEAIGVRSPTKFANVTIARGDQVRYQTPGGGGFGDPRRRAAAAVADDVRDGFVSAEAAGRLTADPGGTR